MSAYQMNDPQPAHANGAGSDLVDAVALCLTLRDTPKSPALIRSILAPDAADDPDALVAGLNQLGIRAGWQRGVSLPGEVLPAVIRLGDGAAGVLTAATEQEATVLWSAQGTPEKRTASSLADASVLLLSSAAERDGRADELVAPKSKGWFWPTLWAYRRYFFEAVALSAVVNLLGLAGIIFMMTVYDRILPNQAYVTLWSLAGGVGIAMVFEFIARNVRGYVLDRAGKKIDLVLGDAVFSRVLGTRLEHKAASSGAFAGVLKEFEAVRAFVTSACLTAVADLPFAGLFLLVTLIIAGPLACVPLAAFLLVGLLSAIVQIPLARAANANLREGAVRHGTVIESLEGLETLKALRAEARMRRRHEASSALVADTAMKSQAISNLVLNLTSLIQQAASAVLLIWGVYLAADGHVTAGALIASVQLNSRTLAPLASLSALAVRFQNARTALGSLNRIMALPLEREPGRAYLSGGHWTGALEMRDVSFSYRQDGPQALKAVSLRIRPGERVAILGRMGSGKSTLLRMLSAMYRPQSGQVLMDGIELGAIEPADIRGNVVLVGQDARLFHGTLRENLRIAAPGVPDADLVRVTTQTGVADIAAAHPHGFEQMVGERGDTMSGGQRQAVAIARALLAKPRVLLLDEPTSAMDQRSEAEIIAALQTLPGAATLVIVTHKQSVLPLVDRIIVMDRGQVVADGPRAEVLAALNAGKVKAAA